MLASPVRGARYRQITPFEVEMAILGSSVLGLWIDLVPEREADFNEWYRTEHLAERVDVPGFLRGRRFGAKHPQSPKYFTAYETESPEVLRSEPYIHLLNNPGPRTREMLPQVRNGFRTAYGVVAKAGAADGNAVCTVRFDAPDAESLKARFEEHLPRIAALPGVASAALCEAENIATGIMTIERRIGGASTPAAAYLFLCEVDEHARIAGPELRALLEPGGPLLARAENVVTGTYDLIQTYVHPGT
jgi:hypothetical protein